jgi:hypothetical protein
MIRNELKKELDLLIHEIELDKEEVKKVPERFKDLINSALQKKLERMADVNEKIKLLVEKEKPLRMKKIQIAFKDHITSFLSSTIFEEEGDKEYFIRNVSIESENSLLTVIVENEEDALNKKGLRLYVRFPDGKIISEMKTTNTFVKCLLDIGVENIMTLDIQLYGLPLIGDKKSEKYQQKPVVDDLYVITQMSNEKRVEILEYISEKLNLDLAIELK